MSADPRGTSLAFSVVDAPSPYRSKYAAMFEAIERAPADKAIEVVVDNLKAVDSVRESVRKMATRRGLVLWTRTFPRGGAYVVLFGKREVRA